MSESADTTVEPGSAAPPPERADSSRPSDASPRRARRGAIVSGAIALPAITAGLVLLAVPLGVWYLSTILRTIVVVIANAASGGGAAQDANDSLGRIDPAALSGITVALAIVGLVLLAGGVLVSVLVLRLHGVERPWLVTVLAAPMGVLLASVLGATVGALSGLLFSTSDTVGRILGNAALGIALTTIGSGIVTIAAGAIVWLWVARLLRAPRTTGGTS